MTMILICFIDLEETLKKGYMTAKEKDISRKLRAPNGGEFVEKEEPLITVGSCVSWSGHSGTLYGVSRQVKDRATL